MTGDVSVPIFVFCSPSAILSLYSFLRILSYFNQPRFQPDKEFAGTDRNMRRDGPVQFERDEEDPFGLDKFLTEAKKAGKRTADEPRTAR